MYKNFLNAKCNNNANMDAALICTDVTDVDLIVQYDCPQNCDFFVYRVDCIFNRIARIFI